MSIYNPAQHSQIVTRAATVAWLHRTNPMEAVQRALREAQLGVVDYPALLNEVCTVVERASLGGVL